MLVWIRLVVKGASAPAYAALPSSRAQYAELRTTRVERTPVRVKTIGGRRQGTPVDWVAADSGGPPGQAHP
jgi:hypothetical protein